jgi:hypothetical protein
MGPFRFRSVYSENTALPLKLGGANHDEHEIKPGVDDFLSGYFPFSGDKPQVLS